MECVLGPWIASFDGIQEEAKENKSKGAENSEIFRSPSVHARRSHGAMEAIFVEGLWVDFANMQGRPLENVTTIFLDKVVSQLLLV